MATVFGSTTRMPTAKAGALIRKAKRPAIWLVIIIKIDKRMTQEEYIKSYPIVPCTERGRC